MSCPSCCRYLFLILAGLFSITATILIIYGGVETYNVKYNDAVSDKVANVLDGFISCSDLESNIPNLNDGSDSDFDKVKLYQCEMTRGPQVFLFVITGLVALLCLIVAFATNCCVSDEKKFNSYAFPTLLALSFGLCVVATMVMGSFTSYAYVRFVPCDKFNDATIARLNADGEICVTGQGDKNETALKWMGAVIAFYVGTAFQMLSVIILLFLNGCCATGPSTRHGMDEPLQPKYQTGVYA